MTATGSLRHHRYSQGRRSDEKAGLAQIFFDVRADLDHVIRADRHCWAARASETGATRALSASCWSAGASTLGGSFHNGRCTLSKPWPDEVIQPYRQVWEHILGNHRPGTSVPSKTAFPSSWSEKRVRHEVLETVAAPDLVRSMKDGNREERYRLVGEEIIRVWLRKKRNTRGRYMINTAFPTVGEEKEMA